MSKTKKCKNKAVAVLQQMQESRPALILKENLIMVLDRPVEEAKAW